MTAYKRWKASKRYSAKLNLLAKIHAAVAPILEVKRKADELLDRCVRSSHEKQGYCVAIGDKYSGHVYKLGKLEDDIAKTNDPFNALRERASLQARMHTQAIDNSESLKH